MGPGNFFFSGIGGAMLVAFTIGGGASLRAGAGAGAASAMTVSSLNSALLEPAPTAKHQSPGIGCQELSISRSYLVPSGAMSFVHTPVS